MPTIRSRASQEACKRGRGDSWGWGGLVLIGGSKIFRNTLFNSVFSDISVNVPTGRFFFDSIVICHLIAKQGVGELWSNWRPMVRLEI